MKRTRADRSPTLGERKKRSTSPTETTEQDYDFDLPNQSLEQPSTATMQPQSPNVEQPPVTAGIIFGAPSTPASTAPSEINPAFFAVDEEDARKKRKTEQLASMMLMHPQVYQQKSSGPSEIVAIQQMDEQELDNYILYGQTVLNSGIDPELTQRMIRTGVSWLPIGKENMDWVLHRIDNDLMLQNAFRSEIAKYLSVLPNWTKSFVLLGSHIFTSFANHGPLPQIPPAKRIEVIDDNTNNIATLPVENSS